MATLQTVKPLYRGIVPPLVTPLVDRDKLDYVGTQRLLEHVIKGGVHGVFILGTTGEAPSLSYRLRREFIKLVSETVDHRVPVFVGVTDTSLVESLRLAESAK
ncbi:MAG: dihydrodipicolinate synthase family protein, partial [Rubripirellula sp.]|nr:dihydrodipicolinate synthase family protein [Rubripirellula sp.]